MQPFVIVDSIDKVLEVHYVVEVGVQKIAELLDYYFFADGVGIARELTPVQKEPLSNNKSLGTEALLVSKNF